MPAAKGPTKICAIVIAQQRRNGLYAEAGISQVVRGHCGKNLIAYLPIATAFSLQTPGERSLGNEQ